MLFFAAAGVCYLIEPHSIIVAGAIGIGAFYFCFIRIGMRGIYPNYQNILEIK